MWNSIHSLEGKTSPAERKKNVQTRDDTSEAALRRSSYLEQDCVTRKKEKQQTCGCWHCNSRRKEKKNRSYTITSGQIFASKRPIQSGLNNPEEKITSLLELFAELLWYAWGTKQGYKGSDGTFQAFLPFQSDL